QKVAFIGLGNMGSPMAVNLVKAGIDIHAFDISEEARSRARSLNLRVATSVAQAVQNANVVISILPASQHVEDLYLGNIDTPGLLNHIQPNALVIDSSTIAASTSKKVAAEAKARNIRFMDAPVSGGTAGAAAGSLTFMVGGSDDDLSTARPVLQIMGQNIFHAGEVGSGQVAKMCNNMLLGILMIGTSEALA